ncbi:hypothetical protein T11_287 [Trichinella zimbabwensis]|uniref:Uncharacterized protein n=1 Tax=Trichinella zimbabwensis TaxID=268475 RepID=A0A0V1H9Q0_9BILA|nr:hypothetical protein T11_287 [Trichinella zimbabwensis]
MSAWIPILNCLNLKSMSTRCSANIGDPGSNRSFSETPSHRCEPSKTILQFDVGLPDLFNDCPLSMYSFKSILGQRNLVIPSKAELKSPPKLVKHRRSDLKGRTTHSLNTWNVALMRMMQWIVDDEVRNNDHQKWMDFELEVLSTCADYFTRWAEDFTRYEISRRTQWSSTLYAVWLPGQRAL